MDFSRPCPSSSVLPQHGHGMAESLTNDKLPRDPQLRPMRYLSALTWSAYRGALAPGLQSNLFWMRTLDGHTLLWPRALKGVGFSSPAFLHAWLLALQMLCTIAIRNGLANSLSASASPGLCASISTRPFESRLPTASTNFTGWWFTAARPWILDTITVSNWFRDSGICSMMPESPLPRGWTWSRLLAETPQHIARQSFSTNGLTMPKLAMPWCLHQSEGGLVSEHTAADAVPAALLASMPAATMT